MSSQRNQEGLSERQIEKCQSAWKVIGGNKLCQLEISEAASPGSRTRFSQTNSIVHLGADVMPGRSSDARSRMSMLACLAHELAHAERYQKGYDRPLDLPDLLIDEAETSLSASFTLVLGRQDRDDLVEDAQNQIVDWLTMTRQRES